MKTIKFILLLTFIGFFPVSCCKDTLDYSEINSISLYLFKGLQHSNPVDQSGQVGAGPLTIRVNFDYQYIANITVNNLFISNSYANSCPEPGKNGLKDKIDNIVIVSDSVFNAIPSGQVINGKFTASFYNTDTLEISINQMKDSLNILNYFFWGHPIDFVIKEVPTDKKSHKFKITFTFKSGRQLIAETSRVIWD